MHERKEFTLKKKLTTTSLLGPRISCHFFISSSSSKGVSFIPWKTMQSTCINIKNNIKVKFVKIHSQPAMQHTFATICKVLMLVSEKKITCAYIKTCKTRALCFASLCGPDNKNVYLSDVCQVSLLVHMKKKPSLLPCLSSVS